MWSWWSIVWGSYLVSHLETPLCFLKIGGQEILSSLTFRSLIRQIMSLDVSIFLCRRFCYKMRHVFSLKWIALTRVLESWISKGQSGRKVQLVDSDYLFSDLRGTHTIREKERNSEWHSFFYEARLCTSWENTGTWEDDVRLASWHQGLK